MRKLTADLVQMTTTTAGAGNVAMVQSPGWLQFSDRFVANDRSEYSIRDGNNWEWGFGTYNAVNILVRTFIKGSLVAGVYSGANVAIALSGGVSTVRAIISEELFSTVYKIEHSAQGVNFTAVDGFAYAITANAITATLNAAPLAGDRMRFFQGAAAITGFSVDPGASLIQGIAGVMSVDLPDFDFSLVYIGAGYGWKVDS